MTDTAAEERIRELRRRLEREPGSRYFVPLAEELRRSGRLAEAIAALEGGLELHPGYVAARIALARAYLEAGRIEESIRAFSRALTDDPSNLVAAKALGDLYLSRGEKVEALKRYLRYRAISGDRRLDDTIARLEAQAAPPPESVLEPIPSPPPPPPPALAAPPVAPDAPRPEPASEAPPARRRDTDPFDITSVPYERPADVAPLVPELPGAFSASAAGVSETAEGARATPGLSLPDSNWFQAPVAEAPTDHSPSSPGPAPALPSGDPARERRLAKVRVLNEWLGALTRAADGR